MSAKESGTVKIWCHKCKDFVIYPGVKDLQGAFHIEKVDIDAHRATHA